MKIQRWMGVALAVACLGLGGCKIQPRRINYSTSSDEAKQLYLQGCEALDVLRVDDARVYFQKAVEEDPDFALAHLALAETAPTPAERLESTKRALAQNRSISEGERLLILAFEAKTAGNPTMQMDHLGRAARLYPEDERVLIRLGDFYAVMRNRRASSESYLKALKLAPDFSVPHFRLSQLYRSIGQFERAETALKEFVDRNPSEPRPLELYGDLLLKLGRFDEALATYQKVLEMDSDATAAQVGIGNVFLLRGEMEEARGVFREMYDQAGDDAQRREALLWLAALHVHSGEPAKAVEELQKAYALAKKDKDIEAGARLLNLMGEVWLESGDVGRAAPRFAESQELVERSDSSSRRKQHAVAIQTYYDARMAIARNDLRTAWTKVAEYRTAAGGGKATEAKNRFTELGGRVALASGNAEMALEKLGLSDVEDPRILFLMALAYREKGDERAAVATATQVRNFNEPRFELAFVRPKAQKLLDES